MNILRLLPLSLILIIRHVPVARGVKCLACADVPHARDCAFVQECPAHQVCSGELFVTAAGNPRYKLGCKDKSSCGSGTVVHGVSHVACSQCCDTPLCNSQLCYDSGYGPRSSRGPVCLDCQNKPDPAQCDKVKTCSIDETCGVIETKVNLAIPSTYRILCVAKRICPALQAYDTCTGCCDDDLCTNNCTTYNPTIQFTPKPTTPTTTTPTTATTTLIPSTTQPTMTASLSNTAGSSSSTCVDDAACASVIALYQPVHKDVCADAAIGATYCMKTCGLCTTPAPTTTTTTTTTATPVSSCSDDPSCVTVTHYLQTVNKDVCQDDVFSATYCRKTCGRCTSHISPGQMTTWTNWAECTKTCGGGLSFRSRTCSMKPCTGPTTDVRACHANTCPVAAHWSDWSHWSSWSATCGAASALRLRVCNTSAQHNGGTTCPGDRMEYRNHNGQPCPMHGQWSSWSGWTACSATCGAGERVRMRVCDNPRPDHGGNGCVGSGIFKESCYVTNCPVDGHWSLWSAWSSCNVTCNGGSSFRYRTCDSPAPAHGGQWWCPVTDATTEVRACNTAICPVTVDGQWSPWLGWSSCSASSGTGERVRMRFCDSPRPQQGGAGCVGHDILKESCCNTDCPVDGRWSTWSSWSSCSATCNGGTSYRMRTCGDPAPSNGGNGCPNPGASSEVRDCNTGRCPLPATTGSQPHCWSCSFDHQSLCDWGNGSSGWSFGPHCGPHCDYSRQSGSGRYVYTQGDSPTAVLVSPLIRHEPRWCIRFHLYMLGSGVAEMDMYAKSEQTGQELLAREVRGDQGRQWSLMETIFSRSYMSSDYRIIIKVKAGYGNGFVALDNVKLCPCYNDA